MVKKVQTARTWPFLNTKTSIFKIVIYLQLRKLHSFLPYAEARLSYIPKSFLHATYTYNVYLYVIINWYYITPILLLRKMQSYSDSYQIPFFPVLRNMF